MDVWRTYEPIFNMFFTEHPQGIEDIHRRMNTLTPGIFSKGWIARGVESLFAAGLIRLSFATP